jgi:hypothetical protein
LVLGLFLAIQDLHPRHHQSHTAHSARQLGAIT